MYGAQLTVFLFEIVYRFIFRCLAILFDRGSLIRLLGGTFKLLTLRV